MVTNQIRASRTATIAWSKLGLGMLCTVYLIGFAAGVCAIGFGSAQMGWPALVREMAPVLYMPAPLLLVSAMVLRSRRLVIGLLVPVALFIAFHELPRSSHATTAADGHDFRVFTFNVGAARGLQDADAVIRAIGAASPDVVCLVEARSTTLTTVGLPLRDVLPYQAASDSVFVLSRFPLSEIRRDVIRTGAHDSLTGLVEVDHQLVSLSIVHLRRIDAYPGLRHGMRPLLDAVRKFSTEERDAAVSEIAEMLRDDGGPRILVGDFNMTPTSSAHRVLTTDLKDAFFEGGWGPGHTYPAMLRTLGLGFSLPLVRIDYIFVSDDLVVRRAQVGPDGNSDHLPVFADLTLR